MCLDLSLCKLFSDAMQKEDKEHGHLRRTVDLAD